MALNAKQQRFVEEYLIDLNATQAAIRAGYSAKTAHSHGSRLLNDVEIAAAISSAKMERAERTGITQDRVLDELAKIGFSDLRKMMTSGGALRLPDDWDDETAGAISSIEVITRPDGEQDAEGRRAVEAVHKIRAWDKISALEKIGKHLGMFEGAGGGGDEVASALRDIAGKLPG